MKNKSSSYKQDPILHEREFCFYVFSLTQQLKRNTIDIITKSLKLLNEKVIMNRLHITSLLSFLLIVNFCHGASRNDKKVSEIIHSFTLPSEQSDSFKRAELEHVLTQKGTSCPALRAEMVACCSRPTKVNLLCGAYAVGSASICLTSPSPAVACCCASASALSGGSVFFNTFMRSEDPSFFTKLAAYMCGISPEKKDF